MSDLSALVHCQIAVSNNEVGYRDPQVEYGPELAKIGPTKSSPLKYTVCKNSSISCRNIMSDPSTLRCNVKSLT